MEYFFAQRLLGQQICDLDAKNPSATQFSANATWGKKDFATKEFHLNFP